ncbi:unnamed protein product [Schistosoma spindalis]|nr:unnamed protein product [Schistosoma spindale]
MCGAVFRQAHQNTGSADLKQSLLLISFDIEQFLVIINTLVCIGQFQVVLFYVNELCLPESKLIGNDSEDLAASSHIR